MHCWAARGQCFVWNIACRLAETLNDSGRDAVGVYLGNPNVHALASATHGIPFVKALRTRNPPRLTRLPAQLVACNRRANARHP